MVIRNKINRLVGLSEAKVSVIVPVYNTARYLEEALNSIYDQTIGLDNIQVILVDDGSTDGSAEICRNARSLHRRNIEYYRQQNKGLSAVRNEGLRHVRGRYVTFVDSDDTIDRDFLKRLYSFMENNRDTVNMAVGRLRYFEKKDGFLHKLDYKFSRNGVADLKEKPDHVQQHVISALFKSEIARKYTFDENLELAEDVLYVSEYLTEGLSYGVVKDAVYNYRIREDNTAYSSRYLFTKRSYEGIVGCYDRIIKLSEEHFGFLLPYYQHVVMFDLQFRIANELPDVFSDEKEKTDYINGIKGLLKRIDDSVILKQRTLLLGYKIYALSLKHGFDITERSTISDAVMYFNGNSYLDLRNHLRILSVEKEEGGLKIKGRQSYSIIKDAEVHVRVRESGECVPISDYSENDIVFRAFDGNTAFTIKGFSVTVPCGSLEEADFVLNVGGGEDIILNKNLSRRAVL
ncbi:MAG: glycosyltransferase family 2 protein [Bacillota bacterium]